MEIVMSKEVVAISISVVLGVIALVFLLVIVDHKSKIGGAIHKDIYHISGQRVDHPIWSYIVGALLLTIIGFIALQLALSAGLFQFSNKETQSSKLLEKIEKSKVLEQARHFHNSATAKTLEGDKSVCFYCHGDFPHFEKPMIRTLLNMHTQFIGCMTCHIDPKESGEDNIVLDWLNYSGIDVSGPRFGTDYAGNTGFLIDTDDLYSKIVAYEVIDGEKQLLEVTENDPVAVDFVKVQEQLQGQERALVKKSFHQRVSPIGRFCTKCHTEEEKSFIPFEELGFSRKRINELTSMNIIGLVQKYKKFYMPQLLIPGADKELIEPLMGPEVEIENDRVDRDDSRNWWRSPE